MKSTDPNASNPKYLEGWNDAIDAACRALNAHQIGWMSDKTFSQMEKEIQDVVWSLKKEPRWKSSS